jgi:type I restriction enzyme S subunit
MASVVAAWPMVALGAVLKSVSRPVSVQSAETYPLLGMHWYAEGLYIKDRKLGTEIQADVLYHVRQGDFVYNRLFGWKGSFGIADASVDGCYVSNEFPCFQMDAARIIPGYLRWYFSLSRVWEEVQGNSSGSTPTSRLRLKEPQLLSMQLPLPPLDEQRRIVARIEELAARIEEARGLRREAAAEAGAIWGAAAAVLLGVIVNTVHTPIGKVAEVRGGIQKGPHRVAGQNPIRYLTVAHVHRNHISLNDPRYFEVNPDELKRWLLKPGDVLIVEGNGSADQIGRAALFRGEIHTCVHQNHVIRIRPDLTQVDPEYLNVYLNSPVGQEVVQARSRTTSGLNILSIGRINSIEIPVPPLVEQRCMVAYLDGVQSKADRLKQLQAETAAELDALLPSVLDKAFRGEL